MVDNVTAAYARQPAAALRVVAPFIPGVLLAATLGMAALMVSRVTPAPAVLTALVLGIVCSAASARPIFAAGLDFSAKTLLRLGVVLLGARITFGQMAELGPGVAAITIAALAVTLGIGIGLARVLKLENSQGVILAGATAICGASAALAVAAALPQSKRTETDTAAAIGGVTIIGAACMLLYPIIAHALGFDARDTGVFLGATLHEVAQAVGAGYAVSPEAGDTATAVKLLRVACLAPVVLMLGWMFAGPRGKSTPVPLFLLGFILMAALASFSVLPQPVIAAASTGSQWLLLIAIAALGVKTSPTRLRAIGPRPFLALVLQTAALAAFVLTGLLLAPL